MPLGRNQRVPRRGANPCHATCVPLVADPPWWTSRMEYGAAALVSLVAFLLYYSTVYAEFAYDDSRAIKTNQDLLPTTPVSALFRNDFWGTPLTHSGSHKSYRPICVLTFRINYWLGGLDPSGYHFFNVILHSIVSGLFTKLASIVFVKRAVPTMVAGLLFAAHPIHTEAVAGIVGRADVGSCLFFILCLLFYMKYCEYRDAEHQYHSRRWLHLYAAIACATLSMLTKEHGITVLAICIVYDLIVHQKMSPKDVTDSSVPRLSRLSEGPLHLIITSAVLLGLRLHLMGSKTPDFAPADNPAADNSSMVIRTLTFFYLPAFNFWLLLCPQWLSFDWSMESIPLLTSPLDCRNFATLAFYGSLIHLVRWVLRSLNMRRLCCGIPYPPGSFDSGSNNGSGGSRSSGNSGNNGMSGSRKTARQFCPCVGITERFVSLFTFNSNRFNSNRNCSSNNNNNNNNRRATNGYYDGYGDDPHDKWGDECNCTCCKVPFINRSETVVFALSLIIIPFIPATNLFFYVGFVIAERVLYLPSMGFCLLVALGVNYMFKRRLRGWVKKFLVICIAILFLLMSARTVRRNDDWMTEENLYRSGIPINPPKAYGNLANILSSMGRKEDAEWAYKKALGYRGNMADVRYNLGILLQEQGRYEEALHSYRYAVHYRPRLAVAHLNMGLVLGMMGRRHEAAQVYRHCAELDGTGLKDPRMHESTRISALFNLGRLYADDGDYRRAVLTYHEAIEKMPDYYQPQSLYNMMGEAFFKLGQFVEAEHWYREALAARPDHIPAHLAYAKLLSKWNRLEGAERWFLRAKALAPNDSGVYQHYGQFLSESERHAEAAVVCLKAAELAPDEYEIVFNAADALRQAGRNAEAETFYVRAVKLKPNEVTGHVNLGAMLHVNGKLLEAEASYLEALRLRPDDYITQNNLKRLKNLRAYKGLKASLENKK